MQLEQRLFQAPEPVELCSTLAIRLIRQPCTFVFIKAGMRKRLAIARRVDNFNIESERRVHADRACNPVTAMRETEARLCTTAGNQQLWSFPRSINGADRGGGQIRQITDG